MEQAYTRKINYYETDQMAIVHHSNYIRYMEEARLFFLEEAGIPYKAVEEAGILIPVLGVQVKYQQAIRYGDEIEIYAWIDGFSQVKFSMLYEIKNKKTGILHATGSSEHCFVDKQLRPVRLKKEYPSIFEAFDKQARLDQMALIQGKEK